MSIGKTEIKREFKKYLKIKKDGDKHYEQFIKINPNSIECMTGTYEQLEEAGINQLNSGVEVGPGYSLSVISEVDFKNMEYDIFVKKQAEFAEEYGKAFK